mmetsp:Transcript_9460/g.28882  ORF Transcript_9460/g.28882 Transcript_9460/m.28882 type:complete len:289 (-) Transcript_9460:357-1223(-)
MKVRACFCIAGSTALRATWAISSLWRKVRPRRVCWPIWTTLSPLRRPAARALPVTSSMAARPSRSVNVKPKRLPQSKSTAQNQREPRSLPAVVTLAPLKKGGSRGVSPICCHAAAISPMLFGGLWGLASSSSTTLLSCLRPSPSSSTSFHSTRSSLFCDTRVGATDGRCFFGGVAKLFLGGAMGGTFFGDVVREDDDARRRALVAAKSSSSPSSSSMMASSTSAGPRRCARWAAASRASAHWRMAALSWSSRPSLSRRRASNAATCAARSSATRPAKASSFSTWRRSS